MPSINDVYNILVDVRDNTNNIHNDLQMLNKELHQSNLHLKTITDILNDGFLNLSVGIKAIVDLQHFNNLQNNTIICNLEKISQHTCSLVNESNKQSGLQTIIANKTTDFLEIYETAHANEALENMKLKEIRKELEECCPQRVPEPPCRHTPCETPKEETEIRIDIFKPIHSRSDE